MSDRARRFRRSTYALCSAPECVYFFAPVIDDAHRPPHRLTPFHVSPSFYAHTHNNTRTGDYQVWINMQIRSVNALRRTIEHLTAKIMVEKKIPPTPPHRGSWKGHSTWSRASTMDDTHVGREKVQCVCTQLLHIWRAMRSRSDSGVCGLDELWFVVDCAHFVMLLLLLCENGVVGSLVSSVHVHDNMTATTCDSPGRWFDCRLRVICAHTTRN